MVSNPRGKDESIRCSCMLLRACKGPGPAYQKKKGFEVPNTTI